MKRRIASLLLAVLLTAAMLTGCGAQADSYLPRIQIYSGLE